MERHNGNPASVTAVQEPPRTEARDTRFSPAREQPPAPPRPFASGRYYVVLAVLVVCALGMQSAARVLEAYFEKLPLELRKPLHLLSVAKLEPEYGLHPSGQPEPLPDDVVESLGTKNYLDWRLIDRTREPEDPTYQARLFLTYYTGQPDMVPHEPRECQQAGGLELVDEEQYVVAVPMPDGRDISIPVAVLQFVPPRVRADGARLTVLFFFYANGDFVTTREGVRLATSNLWDRYAYYSKVELSFLNEAGTRPAGREESKEAAARLLKKLMPILWTDHYPDWDAASRGTSAQ